MASAVLIGANQGQTYTCFTLIPNSNLHLILAQLICIFRRYK